MRFLAFRTCSQSPWSEPWSCEGEVSRLPPLPLPYSPVTTSSHPSCCSACLSPPLGTLELCLFADGASGLSHVSLSPSSINTFLPQGSRHVCSTCPKCFPRYAWQTPLSLSVLLKYYLHSKVFPAPHLKLPSHPLHPTLPPKPCLLTHRITYLLSVSDMNVPSPQEQGSLLLQFTVNPSTRASLVVSG